MNTSIKRKRRAGLFLDQHAAIYYLMTMFKYHGFIFFLTPPSGGHYSIYI